MQKRLLQDFWLRVRSGTGQFEEIKFEGIDWLFLRFEHEVRDIIMHEATEAISPSYL